MSSRLRAIAQETVDIAERGSYRPTPDREVSIAAELASAVAGTRLYLPDQPLPTPTVTAQPTIEVTSESSLAAAARLGGDVACLVFASARNPGGGFLNGAQAQEEAIARSCGLYPCQRAASDFYTYHREHTDLTYTDRVIYAPRVPVFRDDNGTLLAQPYPVSFLTCAAPNRSAVLRNQSDQTPTIPGILARRAARVLAVAAAHGHRWLVLGAWGCGVFGNDPATVATAFADALAAGPWFEQVTFAILDRAAGTPTLAAFSQTLLSRDETTGRNDS